MRSILFLSVDGIASVSPRSHLLLCLFDPLSVCVKEYVNERDRREREKDRRSVKGLVGSIDFHLLHGS